MTYGHLQADCLYTGISSGPNARCRVWEAFTFTFIPLAGVQLQAIEAYQAYPKNIWLVQDSGRIQARRRIPEKTELMRFI